MARQTPTAPPPGPRRPWRGPRQPVRFARWQDWVNLIAGAWEFITPWIFAQSLYQGSPGNAWWTGGAIFVVSLWLLSAPSAWWAEWLNALLGAWLFISPWVLGFGTGARTSPAASWSAWIVGAVVCILSLWALMTNCWGRRRYPV